MSPIEQILTGFASSVQVRAITALILFNVLSGFAVAISPQTPERFYLGRVAAFLFRRVFGYLLCYAGAVVLLYSAPPELRAGADALNAGIAAAIVAALLGKIAAHLRLLGLPIPESLTDRPAPAAKPQV